MDLLSFFKKIEANTADNNTPLPTINGPAVRRVISPEKNWSIFTFCNKYRAVSIEAPTAKMVKIFLNISLICLVFGSQEIYVLHLSL